MAEQGTMGVISGKAAHLEPEVLVAICARARVCACAHVMCSHVHVLACVKDIFLDHSPHLFSEMGSISEPAFSGLYRLANQQSLLPQGLSSAGFTDMCDHAQLFTRVLHA